MAQVVKKNGNVIRSETKATEKIAESKVKARKYKPDGKNDEAKLRILNHNLEIAYWDKINAHDLTEVHNRIVDYFVACQQHGVLPSAAGLASALGVTRNTLSSWLSGRYKQNPEIVEDIANAMATINAVLEDAMQSGNIPPISGIFLAKNNFGYQDTSTQVVVKVDADQTPESLIEAAKLLPD